MLNAIVLGDEDERWTEITGDLDKIAELASTTGMLVWAFGDVNALTSHDVAQIADAFRLHPLAVEDAINTNQRPKLENYDKHLFGVFHQLDLLHGQLEATQITCFVGRRYVLTLHAGAARTLGEATRRCFKGRKLADQGPSFIMHALLDTIVDDYQAIANDMELQVEDLEDRALGDPLQPLQSDLYSLKQRLARLRRYVVPGERVLASVIAADQYALITKRTAAHFRDVHDHTLRIIDQMRNVEDLTDAVIDLQRAEQAAQQNVVTKRLTGWAAIIAVPTFIASVYGMNFALFPREGGTFGFFFALGTMIASGGILFVLFRKRRWI